MKRCWGMVALGIFTGAQAYRRISYVQHDFRLPVEDTRTLLDEIAQKNEIRGKHSPSYSWQGSSFRKDVVYLTDLERWGAARSLRKYPREAPLTPELIYKITTPLWGKRKSTVERVLRDFSKQGSVVTVGSVLDALKKQGKKV